MPGSRGGSFERTVEVVIEEVREAPDLPLSTTPGHVILAVRVRLESHREKLRVLVRPDRFVLRSGEGQRFAPRASGRVEPVLPSGHLRGGASVEGWLTFEIPPDAAGLTLTTDLTIPPVYLSIPRG